MAVTSGASAPWPVRVMQGHLRTTAAIAAGLAVYVLLPGSIAPEVRTVVAWDTGAILLMVLAVRLFLDGSDASMARNAEAQAEGEWVIFAVTLAGVLVSFVALSAVLSGVKDLPAFSKQWHIALVAATLLLSWLVTHVVFALRYAHEYYAADSTPGPGVDGGLEFPGGQAPDYWDFCYFSLVLGMTFQVSDVQITSRKLRRLALAHGLVGFLFNTVIVALTVNIAASLL